MDMAGRGCDGAFAAFVRPFKSDERIFSQRAFTSRRLDTHYSRGNHNIGDSRHGKKHYIENEKRGGLNPTFALGRENRGERGREFFGRKSPASFDEFRDPNAKFGFKHLGIYGYRRQFLLNFARWKPTRLEQVEMLEQLRILEKGYKIKVVASPQDSFGVDVPGDIEKIETILRKRG